MAIFKIGKVVLGSLFKKPATLMYPVVPRQWQERTRGHISIVEADCILCGICVKRCPTHAITVDKPGRTWTIERMDCVQCGSCAENCPKKCLTMEQQYSAPNTVKTVDVHHIPAPAAAEKKAAPAAPGSKLECDLETCIYCGICAKNCPSDALFVDRKEKVWKVDHDACTQCGICVEKCPKDSLSFK